MSRQEAATTAWRIYSPFGPETILDLGACAFVVHEKRGRDCRSYRQPGVLGKVADSEVLSGEFTAKASQAVG